MNNEEQGYVNDFIEIDTKIEGQKDAFETSHYTGVEAFFNEHLKNTLNTKYHFDDVDIYSLEIGDKIYLSQSTWAIEIRKKHKLEDDLSEYKIEYEIINIKLEYQSKSINPDTNLPRLKIVIILRSN
ncbi:hypothetical protein RBH94_15135 [Aestuariibaculum sp. YM273]|uniref:hypothetical protein n=1 Tax=Aestuariibaculum sp. YM273 TaxID=3070659 RepID=UPI0027DE17E7|nr:hypothetical protein [Aestuariibaculum sp. YM273]WMI65385.1 hypothetical protein RBH94_15135 [Aestuariibaculum sp. YM273]